MPRLLAQSGAQYHPWAAMTFQGHPAGHRFGHRFSSLGPANQVTAGRAVLTVAVATIALRQTSETTAWAAVGLGLLVTLLDGVDGWLARRSGMASAFGARFDMEVDAFLILALSVLAWRHGKAGPWIIASGVLRYLFVAAGWCLPWMARPLPPSRRRQTVCVVQIAALLFALLPVVPAPAATGLAAVSLAALCYSFLVDVVWLWQSA